jgi:glycosyltransferase involved in cell wall biosynthesis
MAEAAASLTKILFVLPNFAGGGAERVALTLLAHLDRHTFAPHLAVAQASGPLRPLLAADVALHDIGQPRLRRALPALLSLIRKERPAVVFATQDYVNIALLATRRLMPRGTKIALRESNTPSQHLPSHRHPRLMAWAYRRYYPTTDLLFCQHRQTERELEEEFGVPAAKIAPLPNPVPVAEIRRRATSPWRRPGQGLRFVAAGRLHRQKGFDRLIPLMAQLPADSHLTIFGEGGEEANLTRRIKDLGLQPRVTLEGFTDSLPAALAGADACLISSRWEGLPNVALEALACGTAVIATPESGGIAELAAAAVPGAVTIADLAAGLDAEGGPDFLRAMQQSPQRSVENPAASLLPQRYEVSAVAERFGTRLSQLLQRAQTDDHRG